MLRDGYRPTPRPGTVPHPPQGGTGTVPLAPSYVPDSALEPHTLRGAGEVVLVGCVHERCGVCGEPQIYEGDELAGQTECLCRSCATWAARTLAHYANKALYLYSHTRRWLENRVVRALDHVEQERFRADLAIDCNRLIDLDLRLEQHRTWLLQRALGRLRTRYQRERVRSQARLGLLTNPPAWAPS